MPIPTVEQFKEMLANQPINDIANQLLYGDEVFAFRRSPTAYNSLRRHLTSRLPISGENVLIVGSAKFGFSLKPDAYFRAYHPGSDIDVAIIDTAMFDQIQEVVRSWYYPRHWRGLDRYSYDWAIARMKDTFMGWMKVGNRARYEGLYFPEDLAAMRDITTQWFGAFQSLSLYPDFARRRMRGRLYRSPEEARRYHIEGLRHLRSALN